jgi:hypothetical protein
MNAFEKAWATVSSDRQGEAVAPELRALLQSVYLEVLSEPKNLSSLKLSLQKLLTFLAQEGRTNANCWAVDLFFALDDHWEQEWAAQELPDDFHDVLALIGTRSTIRLQIRTSPKTLTAYRNNCLSV